MNMKNIKILSIFLMLVIAFASCEKDDYTGYSTEVPTNPTITVDLGTITAVTDGVNSSHKITLTMDEPQIVDVAVHILVLEGTATQDEDFQVPERVIIPAGRTSVSFDVKFLADELPEDTETFKLQIGDERTANASITPVTADFTINNATADDLNVAMSWNREIYDTNGALISPTDLADMILLVTDTDGNVLDGADGGSFEALTMAAVDYPDGDYYIATEYYSAMDLGDQGAFDLDFTIDFSQLGVFTGSLQFDGLMNSIDALNNRAILAVVTKSGTSWTYAKYVPDLSTLVGEWAGTDGSYSASFDLRFDSHITTYLSDGKLMIDSLNFLWIQWVWGETPLNYDSIAMNMKVDGTFTIASQYHMTTDYSGAPYDYNAYGYGTWTPAPSPTLVFRYELDQEGFLVADWLYNNGYSDQPWFVADVGLAKKTSYANPSPLRLDNKPY